MKHQNEFTIYAKQLLLEDGFQTDQVVFVKDGRIEKIEAGTSGDMEAEFLVPGMIDHHNHGGHGCSLMSSTDDESFIAWLEGLAQNGTTSVMGCPYTDSVEHFRATLGRLKRIQEMQRKGEVKGARILGVHMEGPYLNDQNPGKAAMNEKYIVAPSIEHYEKIVDGYEDMIMSMTVAPEKDEGFKFTNYLRSKGIRVLAGHTNATYDEGVEAFQSGFGCMCHFFNGSRGIHHREPGILTAALFNEDVYCEAICDFVHVHPAALKILLSIKPADRILIISDAVTLAGLPDGDYYEDGQRVIQLDGVSRWEDGTLTGGGSFVLDGVKNLHSIGVPLEDALFMGSKTPATWLDQSDLGVIKVGHQADLVALDTKLSVDYTLISGELMGAR